VEFLPFHCKEEDEEEDEEEAALSETNCRRRHVWERGCGCVPKKFEFCFLFLLKFNMVCMVWIVLMC
jgi:hypothetical protein